jgi:hypothetical protein
MKKRERRGYDEQFLREAVPLAESGTIPIAQVAPSLASTSRRCGSGGARRATQATERGAARVPSLEKGIAGFGARMRGSWRSARS